MSVTVELLPETESQLTIEAAKDGVSLAQYVRRILEEALPVSSKPPLSVAEKLAILREMSSIPTGVPPLSDEAISRESIYDTLG